MIQNLALEIEVSQVGYLAARFIQNFRKFYRNWITSADAITISKKISFCQGARFISDDLDEIKSSMSSQF